MPGKVLSWVPQIHLASTYSLSERVKKAEGVKRKKKKKKAEGTFRLGSAKPDMLEIRQRDSEVSLCPLRGMGVDGWGGEWEMSCLFGDFELILLCPTLVRLELCFLSYQPSRCPWLVTVLCLDLGGGGYLCLRQGHMELRHVLGPRASFLYEWGMGKGGLPNKVLDAC